jgi:hypothetical protein
MRFATGIGLVCSALVCSALVCSAPGHAQAGPETETEAETEAETERPSEAPTRSAVLAGSRSDSGRLESPVSETVGAIVADAHSGLDLRLLPEDPCARLSLALSELDARAARGGCLAEVRLTNRQDRIDEGVVLLGWGALSVIAGGVVAGVGFMDRDDLRIGFGLGTAGWGLVNALLSLGLLDLGDGQRTAIERDRDLSGALLERAREDSAAAQYQTGTILAVNAGLDAFYVVTGILLWIVGESATPQDRGLMGYGVAMASQGAALLAYDTVTWLLAGARGDRLRTLFRSFD